MRRLTSLDAFFLATEDQRTVANVSALVILERKRANGRRLTRHAVTSLFAQRLHLLPPLRWQLAEVPFGVGHPSWVDGEVDLDFHIRETTLPTRGDDTALTELVARLAAEPMNRSRPLWEAYLIHGLSDDRVALLLKLHHAAVDGVSGGDILSVLLDDAPQGRDVPPATTVRTEAVPNRLNMLMRGVADIPRQQLAAVGAARPTLTHLDKVATIRSLPGVTAVAGWAGRLTPGKRSDSAPLVAPRTAFNARITPHRRLALISLPLVDVLAVKQAHGATVNDVVVALCAGALRTWLTTKSELPDERLLAMVPISTREADERGTFGNKVATMVVPLPTDVAEPVGRIRACRDALLDAKQQHKTQPPNLMQHANDLVPPVVFGPAMRTVLRLASAKSVRPAANVIISNVPGPRKPLYCSGSRVLANYPVSTIVDGMALNFTLLSYLDHLHVGLTVDSGLVPDVDVLAQALRGELEIQVGLLKAVKTKRR
ncbi:wax ester/triacylglycerol synthase family O-acyltransferase [Mycobacterium manitobense]|uniref:Diacylglycerol O-acyltransferase n=2 Tax=[Mycobacterium] manitobense TaxID=190147 RepID=A0A9X2YTM3_9MYCO|nr:wax ester/triacylglycerol synthase family O-acyltransferase [[Mycobacterium] manitobense]